MASGTLGDSNDDLNLRGRCRWTENSKVYTRKTHKKLQKTCYNNDTAPTSISTAEEPITTTPTHAPAHAEDCAASSTPNIPSSTTTPNGTADGDTLQESVRVVGAKDVDICQNSAEHIPHQEQGHPHVSPERNADSSCSAPLIETQQSEHVPSESKDGFYVSDRIDEGNVCQTGQLKDLENLQLPHSDEAKTSDKVQITELRPDGRSEPSPVREHDLSNCRGDSPARQLIGNEEQNDDMVQTLRPQERSEQSLSRENDLPNGRDDSADKRLTGNEEQNDGASHDSFQVAQGNSTIKANGVKSPRMFNIQLPVVDEEQDDVEMMPGSPQVSEGNGRGNVNGVVKRLVISNIDDRIRFNLCKATPKNEINNLKKNLEYELDQVRRLYKQLEYRELQIASHNVQVSSNNHNNITNSISAEGPNSGDYILSQPQHARSNVVDRRLLLRVNSEVGAMAHQETRPFGLARVNSDMGAARNLEPRLFNRQLSVSVIDNRSIEYTEKEKRTPKANQYYRNSEFLLGKDRLPSESNKRSKANNGRRHSGETEHAMGFGFDKNRNQVFKNCSSLLQRLMKHKFGWVFNEPVNAKALGLVDYHDIIKHPMDLGTIKTRLSQNLYKSPREFAEDVRLVFQNAMTYNPKGQDVHVMAEQLSQIFEERWAIIESEYNPYWKYQVYQDGSLPTPTSRKGVPYPQFGPASVSVPASIPLYASLDPQRTSDRPEPVTPFMAVDVKMHRPHVGRTPVPKKPKAKDPNKRDMTYEEKQRLSTNLQSLPPEKLDAIVQIIKKRNTTLSQHDDEIEVDIDSVDAETLWELDRFVTNYKKSLSKNKRKAELALQARTMPNQNVMLTNSTPEVSIQNGSVTDCMKGTTLVDESERNNRSSSSSSSSDSGSTSSDSDSDSSSGDGSDAGHSPKT